MPGKPAAPGSGRRGHPRGSCPHCLVGTAHGQSCKSRCTGRAHIESVVLAWVVFACIHMPLRIICALQTCGVYAMPLGLQPGPGWLWGDVGPRQEQSVQEQYSTLHDDQHSGRAADNGAALQHGPDRGDWHVGGSQLGYISHNQKVPQLQHLQHTWQDVQQDAQSLRMCGTHG